MQFDTAFKFLNDNFAAIYLARVAIVNALPQNIFKNFVQSVQLFFTELKVTTIFLLAITFKQKN